MSIDLSAAGVEPQPLCDVVTKPPCRGCAEVATSIGITLAAAHKSCRRVTVENIAVAARRMNVPLMDMFKPV